MMDSITEDPVTETSPLLGEDRSKSSSKTSVAEIPADHRPWLKRLPSQIAAHWAQWKVCYICAAFVLVLDFGGFVADPASLRMLEAAICRRYYAIENPVLVDAQNDVPELYCKVDPVQEELALINGWRTVFESLVGVIVAIPWGVLADKKGRRFIAALGFIGALTDEAWYYVVCYFYNALPPRMIWLGSAFLVIGGGPTVIIGILIGITADAATPDVRAQVLFLQQAVVLAALLVGPPIGALLLKHLGYWPGALVGFSFELASAVLLAGLPTVSQTTKRHVTGGDDEARDLGQEIHNESQSQEEAPQGWMGRQVASIKSNLLSIFKVIDLMFTNVTLGIGFFALMIAKGGQPIMVFLPQFVSRRFGWTISDASYIKSVQAAVSLLMFMLILPTLITILKTRYRISGPPLDLRVARASVPFLVMGCTLLGWAADPPLFILALVIYVLGSGFRGALEAFLASAVRPDQMATLYVAISVVDTLGLMLCSPLLAVTFAQGLHRGGAWIGLPFLSMAALYAVSALLTGFLRVRRPVMAAAAAAAAEEDEDAVAGLEDE